MKNKAPEDLIEILTRLSMSMNFESSDDTTKSYIAGYRMALTNVADMYNCYEEYRLSVELEKQKEKGSGMTRQETLNIIASLNETLDKMSDEELYAHMMKTSPSFRATIKAFNEFVEVQEQKGKSV